jgi:hypothetical protein
MEYQINNRFGETLTMKNGEPFIYTSQERARLGAKFLKLKTPRKERPLRVVPAP